jgi:cobalt/nickel transport system permease protein
MDLARYTAELDSPLHLIDGRIKTGVFLSAVVLSSTLTHWMLALGLWVVAVGLFLSLHFEVRALLARLLMPMSIAWVVFLSVLFTQGSHPLFVIAFKFVTLTAWREGAMQGLLLFMRIMAAVTLATLLAFSTPMIEILETLRLCKIPGTIVDIADMMYRYIFIIQDTAQTMHRAQLSRMGDRGSWVQRVGDTARIACSILIKSLDRSTRIYQAMLARGYSENATEMQFFSRPVPARDKLIGGASAAAMLLLAIANACWA